MLKYQQLAWHLLVENESSMCEKSDAVLKPCRWYKNYCMKTHQGH